MDDFDKKIYEMSKELKIPEEYNRRVDEVLKVIPELDEAPKARKRRPYRRIVFAVACILCLICLLHISVNETEAGLFAEFKLTIMDLLKLNEEESEDLGVSSDNTIIQSKPDLQIELRETIIDQKSIYLLIQITAPKEIEFDEDISFEYYAFCEGENYVAEKLVTGIKECKFAERIDERTNMATYVVDIMTDQELKEGEKVTVYLKNLTKNPDSSSPELLVEGMWSITFPVDYTLEEDIVVEGTPDMEFAYINTTAFVRELRITPLGMTLSMDISNFPREELALADTRLEVCMKMIDGTEHVVCSKNIEMLDGFASGDTNFNEDGEKTYQTDNYMFTDLMDIRKIAGISVEDLYIPLE